MEARRTFQGSKSYRQLWIVLAALMAAAILGLGGAFVASGALSSAPQIVKTHAAPGTVLNQDNYRNAAPPASPGTVLSQDNDRGSAQTVYSPSKQKQTVF